MEGRRLLSVALVNSVLNLNGGGGNDTYTLTKSGTTNISVVENGGAAKLFAISSVNSIYAVLAGGNDQLNIANVLTIPAYVLGGAGDDGIITGGGDDYIDGGTGNDYIDPRNGYDTVSYASRQDPISGSDSVVYSFDSTAQKWVFQLTGRAGGQGEVDDFINSEAIAGGSGNDTLSVRGGYWNDYYEDGTHPNVPLLRVDGNGGNDRLSASNSQEQGGLGLSNSFPLAVAYGGDGDDEFNISGSSRRATTLYGGAGNDYFENGTDDSATLVPGDGFDTFRFDGIAQKDYTIPAGLEKLFAVSAGVITGNDEANIITGDATYIDAKGGNDVVMLQFQGTILGGDGNDTLSTGEYPDSIDGGAGNDVINAGGTVDYTEAGPAAFDTVNGGDGNDELIHASGYFGTVHFDGGPGADRISVDDTGFSTTSTYTLTATSYLRAPDFDFQQPTGVIFSSVGALTLLTGTGDDRVIVNSLPANFIATINTGAGVDTLTVNDMPSSSTINYYGGNRDQYGDLIVNPDGVGTARVVLNDFEQFRTLSIGAGGNVSLKASGYENNSMNVQSLVIDVAGVLDIANNHVLVGRDSNGSVLAQIDALIRSGRAGGSWTGNGIRSSSVPSTPNATVGSVNYSDAWIILRLTTLGDIDCDRIVNFNDLVILAQNYNESGRLYSQGNVDYSGNGVVDFSDLVMVAQHYGSALITAVASSVAPAAKSKKQPASVAAGILR